MIKDLEKTPLVELIDRLTHLDQDIGMNELEYNKIVKELWRRIPSLKDEPHFQLIEPRTKATIIKNNIDWLDIKNACRTTISKEASDTEPSSEWKKKILICQHSPIRKGTLTWKWETIPYAISTHFARHHQGVEKFVSTSREDRTGMPREQRSQMDYVSMEMEANIEALQNISERRLCLQADKITIQYWKSLLEEVKEIEPEIYWSCVPQCVANGGCKECFSQCHYYETLMKDATPEQQMNLIKRYDYYNERR